jgi:HSP20 family protein
VARDWLEILQEMEQWSRDVDRFMTHVSNRSRSWGMVPTTNYAAWSPAVNIYDTEEALLVIAELAGVAPDEIHIKYEANRLLVWGQRQQPDLESIRAVHRMEIQMGPFAFIVDLPGSVSADGADASLEAGILQIRLPKRSAAESGMIQIRSGLVQSEMQRENTEEKERGHE